jgi:hypothetical protein
MILLNAHLVHTSPSTVKVKVLLASALLGLQLCGAPRPYPSSVADYCGGRAAVVPLLSSAEPAEAPVRMPHGLIHPP